MISITKILKEMKVVAGNAYIFKVEEEDDDYLSGYLKLPIGTFWFNISGGEMYNHYDKEEPNHVELYSKIITFFKENEIKFETEGNDNNDMETITIMVKELIQPNFVLKIIK